MSGRTGTGGGPASVRTGASGAPAPDTVGPRAGDEAPFSELTARRLGPVRRYLLRHPVAMDVLVMALFALPGLAGLVVAAERPAGPPTAAYVALVLAATAALFWRRRRPLLTAVVLTALFALAVAVTSETLGLELALGFAMYAVAASRPTWQSWAVFGGVLASAALAVAGSALGTVPVPQGDGDALELDERASTLVGVAVFLLVALAVGVSVRNRRLHVADLVERANALARDRERLAELARAAERSRIAREMHDVVAHSLSVMVTLADGAGVALDRAPDRARVALEELARTGRGALADMRRVLGVLDGPDPERGGAAPLAPQPDDLCELVERFRTAGLPVRANLTDPLPDDPALRLAVYRIAQEALTNALRHARGTARVALTVARQGRDVVVEVVDDGAALPVAPSDGAGRGLIGMRERVAVFGGTVETGPWRGGWRVRAVLPWRKDPS